MLLGDADGNRDVLVGQHVGPYGKRLTARGRDLRGDTVQLILASSREHDARALCGERLRRSFTDTGTRTCDQCNLSTQTSG
ncbi:hypothetical protein GCM10009610_48890 [Pseudonocardia xinjiangensis]